MSDWYLITPDVLTLPNILNLIVVVSVIMAICFRWVR